jgi:predicted O-methyltransferase YrrM
VVELGPGVLPDNLIALSARYPDARIYGIEQDAGNAYVAEYLIQQLGLSNRIQIINANYATYAGPLQHNADVVVAVEPNYNAPVVSGIRNFVKPGGEVLVITEFYQTRDAVVAASGGKARVRTMSATNAQGVLANVQIMQTSLGVPLVSQFTQGNTPWEIHVPSW